MKVFMSTCARKGAVGGGSDSDGDAARLATTIAAAKPEGRERLPISERPHGDPIQRPQATTEIQSRMESAPAVRTSSGGDASFSHCGRSRALIKWKIIMFAPAAQIKNIFATK